MLGVLNNKRFFQSNKIFKYSLETTYKSINERIDREKNNKLDDINNYNYQKVIPIKNKIINIITLVSITSFFFYIINKE